MHAQHELRFGSASGRLSLYHMLVLRQLKTCEWIELVDSTEATVVYSPEVRVLLSGTLS